MSEERIEEMASNANPMSSSLTQSKCYEDNKNGFLTFFGEFKIGSDFLSAKPNKSPWIVIKLMDGILRGVGQVCFSNNSITGLFVLIGLALGSPMVALASVVASVSSITSSYIFDQPCANVFNGLNQFNAVLIGTVLTSLYPILYSGSEKDPVLWLFVIVGCLVCVLIQNGLGNLLGSIKFSLPVTTFNASSTHQFKTIDLGLVAFTFPFNVVGYICLVILSLRTNSTQEDVAKNITNVSPLNVSISDTREINWYKVMEGGILSIGQVYAVNTMAGSLLMIIGFCCCSPLLSFVMVLGGYLGTLSALFFKNGESLEAIYNGIYGYNSVLTAGALGGFFCVITWRSIVRFIIGIILTSALQIALEASLNANIYVKVPSLTMPFVLACWMVLLMSARSPQSIPRVENPSIPETHFLNYISASNNEKSVKKITEKI